jgi:hypothetical protein
MKNIDLQNMLKSYTDDMDVSIHDINTGVVEFTGDPKDGIKGYYSEFAVMKTTRHDLKKDIVTLVFDNPFAQQKPPKQ